MNRKQPEKENKLLNILIGLFLAVLVIVFAVFLILAVKAKKAEADRTSGQAVLTDTEVSSTETAGNVEKWQEGDVLYKGKTYHYNNHIKTYLFMGIDRSAEATEAAGGISGGQSDAMFLLVEDTKNETISIVAIHRNTMALVDTYDINGNPAGQKKMQICLQHSYGDGLKQSCIRSVDAVSRLFYNVPISGYFAMNMDGIPALNDAVGGIEVEVLNDLKSKDRKVDLKKGDIVTLTGDEAYVYLRSRDVDEFDSASLRLKRQEQYIDGLMTKLQEMLGSSKLSATGVYSAIESYSVSSMDFAGLVSEAVNYEPDSNGIYTVPGETTMGASYEEYNLDETAFYEMVLNVFYEETEE